MMFFKEPRRTLMFPSHIFVNIFFGSSEIHSLNHLASSNILELLGSTIAGVRNSAP